MKDQTLISLEMRISIFLRYGVVVAGMLLFIGWMGTLVGGGTSLTSFQTYQEQPLSETWMKALQDQNWSLLICYLGLFVLIALPVSRVALTAALFLVKKEYRLSFLALFVMLMLAVSAALGITHGGG